MTLKKAYEEISDNPEFSDGLTMGDSQSIYDSKGFPAIDFSGFTTRINAPNGDRVFDTDITAGGAKSIWYANSNRDVGIYDDQFGGNAVTYNSSASAPGTLELIDANLDMSGQDITNADSVSADVVSIGTGDVETRTISITESASEIFTVPDGNSSGEAIIGLTGDFDRAAVYKAYWAEPASTFNSSTETTLASPSGGVTLNWNENTLEASGDDGSSNEIHVTVVSQKDPVTWA